MKTLSDHLPVFIFITFLLLVFSLPVLAENGEPTPATSEPVLATDTIGEEEQPGDRDPFIQAESGFVKPDFDKAAASCQLRGIIKAGNLVKGFFVIDEQADNPSGRQLLVKRPGDEIVIMFDRLEYRFTITRFGSRSVKLVDENDKTYDVLL